MQTTPRILHILKYLQDKTDEQHPKSIKQIITYLEQQGITAHRQTITNDIQQLIDFGVDIVTVRSTQNLYFIGERHFELPEIKLLIDAVLSSKSITPKKSGILMDKLRELVSEYQRSEFANDTHADLLVKPENENIYIITDTIHTAINQKKQISFKYYEIQADKSKALKHNGYIYVFTPYALIWNEDKYYAIGYSQKHEKIVTFRVDRMCEIDITEENPIPCPSDFDMAAFCRQVFGMYDGQRATVELKCKHFLMKVIIDKFGEGARTEIVDDDWFKVTVEVYISPTFYGWLFQFTEEMILVAPDEIVSEYKKRLSNATANL